MDSTKQVHTLVLDTGAIIKNDPPASTLLQQAEKIVTIPSILSEIKDASTRNRFDTTLRPFVTFASPEPASVRFVTEFARKTGDLAVLSRPDIELIALTYQLECRQSGGDWRLRNSPGQKKTNGQPPKGEHLLRKPEAVTTLHQTSVDVTKEEPPNGSLHISENQNEGGDIEQLEPGSIPTDQDFTDQEVSPPDLESLTMNETSPASTVPLDNADDPTIPADDQAEADSDSDSDGWITPKNLKRKQQIDGGGSAEKSTKPPTMQVAIITSDYAMQNVILQINLNLLSPSMYRIKQLKTHVLRCHACFHVCKDLTKQFCPRCGQATLNRVSCSTNANGEFKLHLKKNMQWNLRGDRYSVPKPVHGSANGKLKGGGKGGWGNTLMLAEDQKEYQSATRENARRRERGLMDEDYLPSILTGDRGKSGGRIVVGAGRNVNSKKR